VPVHALKLGVRVGQVRWRHGDQGRCGVQVVLHPLSAEMRVGIWQSCRVDSWTRGAFLRRNQKSDCNLGLCFHEVQQPVQASLVQFYQAPERVCCLLVLNSVTSTPQSIRQPEAA
jgi:hypothetical protein